MKKISLFPYPGGKFYLLDEIIRIYEESQKTVAVDVFGGSAKFLMNVPAKNKVYNDLDSRLVNLFRIIRENPEELKRKFQFIIYSREFFNEALSPSPDPVEDAFRFLYSQLCSFAGRGGTFGYEVSDIKMTHRLANITNIIESVHNEVKKWIIEHINYKTLIKRYDSENTFFYLDPPYHGYDWYKFNFTDQDFLELANIIKNIKGKYLMNINKDEFVVDTFGAPTLEKQYANMCNLTKNRNRSKRVELFYWN